MVLTTFAAEAASTPVMAKSIMLAFAFSAAALGLGLVGANYMKALGRNPEAGKSASQLIIIAAMIEVTALLAFVLVALGLLK